MARDAGRLPAWVTWQRRPFPDANLLLLHGRQPALVDSGFSPRGGNSRVGTHARRARRAGRQHPLAFGPRRGTRCCKPRNETPDQRQKRTLLTLGVPGVIASRPAVLGWEWGRGRGGEWRGFLGLFDRMHAGGRICNLECRVDAGQDFLWGHDWLLQAGWQRYSTEVPQRTRTEVVAEGRRRTVTCGDGRGWTCCRQMACKRSGVRISLAPQEVPGRRLSGCIRSAGRRQVNPGGAGGQRGHVPGADRLRRVWPCGRTAMAGRLVSSSPGWAGCC